MKATVIECLQESGLTDFVANVFEVEIREPAVKH